MAYEAVTTRRGELSLRPLVDKSSLLDIRNGRLVVLDKIETPVDRNGVPIPQDLIKQVLATIATRHIWTGDLDVHHVAWPEATYKKVNQRTDGHLGGLYRGSAALKIRLMRQLHNYIHATTVPAKPPTQRVMAQWALEQSQLYRLDHTLSFKSMAEFDLPEEERERYRFSNFSQKLEEMTDGELGLMPSIDFLSGLDMRGARREVRLRARVHGLSNSRSSRRTFYGATIER